MDVPTETTARQGRHRRTAVGSRGRHKRRARALAVPLLVGAIATASAPGLIRIKPGDTLWALARQHHTTVAALKQANGLTGDTIYAGRLLKLPGNNAAPSASTTTDLRYRVERGDSVYYLARKFGASPASIAQRNHLNASRTIYIGQTLLIPVARTVSATTTSSATASTRSTLAAQPRPSKAQVQAVITRTAQQLGVEPSLALAVAYQESGFQQHVVSPVGAVGAMQVMPATGRWLSSDIVGRNLDLLDLEDNVYAGVTQLRLLLRAVDTTTALAGYYQGLASVQQRGMYDDTKAYVRSVLALRSRFA